jgi:spermidine synthase
VTAAAPGRRTLPRMPRPLASILVFSVSAAVLVLEILAGRLMAPYVGVTLETFTAIIGVILAGIAAGAWAGGRAADRGEPRRLLGPLVIVGGALGFLSIPFVDWLGSGLLRSQGATPSTVVLLAAIGFFAPAAVLSAVSPVVVKIQLEDLERTGETVGRFSAVGTAGALFGTFVTGFVLVAAAPTRPLIRATSLALVVAGIALAAWLGRGREVGAGTLALALVGGALSFAATDPCEHESAYFCAFVDVDPAREGGRVLWLDTLRHSYVDLDDPAYLEFSYARTYSDVIDTMAPEGEPLDVVHIGGGGFTFPRYLRATRPGTHSTVLELDPLLVEIAETELGFEPGDDVDVRTGDARLTLDTVPDASADLVLGDAFGGVSVPWHLTTREFLEMVRGRLRADGIYMLNMIDYGPRDFARAEAATLADVFEHVAVLAPPERLLPRDASTGGNFVMVASDAPLDLDAILASNAGRGDDETAVSTADGSLASFTDGAMVLTDDHAPVDQLITTLPG